MSSEKIAMKKITRIQLFFSEDVLENAQHYFNFLSVFELVRGFKIN